MSDPAGRLPARTSTQAAAQISAGPFARLREQLLGAAGEFGSGPVAEILGGLVEDVDRALREPLEIFPVCHHSPSSAMAMARRLRAKQPKVIYLELCEDLRPLLDELPNCRPPVALQSFATEIDGFPAAWAPLSVVAPITEASAEYQAISYALTTPGVELVLVDRSTDHVFQWEPREDEAAEDEAGPDEAGADEAGADGQDDEAALHGDAVGVEIGDLRPRFAELEEHLLHHGKVRHWSEWWDQYVEQPLVDADYDTYRQVMVMIGTLFRRLRPERSARTAVDEDRERYMWTRMREHLASSGADPADCLYVCGAFHAASRVAEFGLAGATGSFEIGPRTGTRWRYGLIPSSHSAIEAQFGLAPGSASIAAATWAKALSRSGVRPFRLSREKAARGGANKAKKLPAPVPAAPVTDRLSGFLATAPAPDYSTVLEAQLDVTGSPVGVEFTEGYLRELRGMLVRQENPHAANCIHGVAFGFMNAKAADDGFLRGANLPGSEHGIWLAGDYQGQWTPVRIASVNDGPAAQVTTAVDMARLVTRMFDGSLESGRPNDLIAMLAPGVRSRFHSALLWPRGNLAATHAKVGIGPLKPNSAGVIEQVVSEALVAHDGARDLDFVVVWQNLKTPGNPPTRTEVERVVLMVEAAIAGFRP